MRGKRSFTWMVSGHGGSFPKTITTILGSDQPVSGGQVVLIGFFLLWTQTLSGRREMVFFWISRIYKFAAKSTKKNIHSNIEYLVYLVYLVFIYKPNYFIYNWKFKLKKSLSFPNSCSLVCHAYRLNSSAHKTHFVYFIHTPGKTNMTCWKISIFIKKYIFKW